MKTTETFLHRQIASFQKNGFLIFDPKISNIKEISKTIRERLSPYFKDRNRIQDAWRYIPEARKIAIDPNVLQLLGTLYEKSPLPFQTLHFLKGSQQAPHSDNLHFQSDPPGWMCGVWIALEDTDAANGPFCAYPGSQQFSLDEYRNTQETIDIPTYEKNVSRVIEEHALTPEYAHLKQGQALVFHANLLHGGMPIADPLRTRLSQVTHYFFRGMRYWTPLESNFLFDKKNWREVFDIKEMKIRKQWLDGKQIQLPWRKSALEKWRRFALSHPSLMQTARKFKKTLNNHRH